MTDTASIDSVSLHLTPNDMAFLEMEADLTQSSPEDILKDALSLYRKRAHEMKEEMGEGCCGGGCCRGDDCC